MTFSLDVPTPATLKAEATALRAERKAAGETMTHSAALEAVARRHGYRDWNTASATLPERVVTPVQVGDRVAGTYLGNAFTGMVVGVQLMVNRQFVQVTLQFDKPVDVSKSKLFSAFRQRVTATLDLKGVSPAHTSDGEPHMRLRRA